MLNIVRKLSVFSIVIFGLLCHGAASAAPIDVTVDAVAHCFETGSHSASSVAHFTLPPGRYVASVPFSDGQCRKGDPSCGTFDTVIMATQGGPNKTAWGIAIKKGSPVVIDIPGTISAAGTAFVIDSICDDNSGSVTLRFQKVN